MWEVSWPIPPYHIFVKRFSEEKKARRFKRYIQRAFGIKAKLTKK